MKRLIPILLSLLSLLPCGAVPADSARRTTLLCRDWRYVAGDPSGAARPDYDDREWTTVGLPHSFSIPYFMSQDFYSGYGWYRRQVHLPAARLGRRHFIEFDGVFREAEVYVNGHPAGRHSGGYTGFSVDATPYLRAGRNVIAVRVCNRWRADLAPRAGEHTFSGGIYRNVRWVEKGTAYLPFEGVAVDAERLAETGGEEAVVRVTAPVVNAAPSARTLRFEVRVFAPDGSRVATLKHRRRVAARSADTLTLHTKVLRRPQLWSPETPRLYRAEVRLYDGRRCSDRTIVPFGLRWMEWTADRGFFLNGRHVYLRGANVHQDQAGWGDAVTDASARRDVAMMREAGFNFIRGSHYPHSPAFTQACDELGVLFWSEAPFWGIGGHKGDGWWDAAAYPADSAAADAFEESALCQLREMIRTHRNHPSVIAWSMSNEPFFTTPATLPGVRRLLRRMVAESRRLDPSRPAAVGGVQRPLGAGRIDSLGDVAGYNGDGANIPEFRNPGFPTIVAEYGSTTADRPGLYAPGWGDLAKDDGWRGHPWRSGQAIWCGFDHGSIAGTALGRMGIVDYYRLPKRSWYWYRHALRGIDPPAWSVAGKPHHLALAASATDSIRTDGTDDVHLTVTVCDSLSRHVSSTPSVTLRVVSGPGEFPTGRTITFAPGSDIRILDGQAAITLRAYRPGRTVVEATSEGLPPARVHLRFTGEEGAPYVPADRPYRRYRRGSSLSVVQTFGTNNPAFASTAAPGHAAGLAADGDTLSCWRPAPDDGAPWWLSDTEKRLRLSSVDFWFGAAQEAVAVVEVSDDKQAWRSLDGCEHAVAANGTLSLKFPAAGAAPCGRFVRIRFVRGVAAVSEVAIRGTVI